MLPYDNGRVIALSLTSGRVLWQTTISPPAGRNDLERLNDIDADPVVVNDVIYIVSYQGKLAALDLASGQVLWSRKLDSYQGMQIDPYRIYLTDSSSVLWALDRNNGSVLWRQEDLTRRNITRPLLHKQYVIVGDYNGYAHWIRRDNGKLVARIRMHESGYTNLDIEEVDADLFARPRNILAAPVLYKNTIVMADRFGNMEAFTVSYP